MSSSVVLPGSAVRRLAARASTAVLVIAVGMAGCAGLRDEVDAVPEGVPRHAQRATVVHVVDGDTIAVEPQQRGRLAVDAAHTVRLLLVDAPETRHPDEPVACYGPQAADFVAEQLLGTTVWVEADGADTDRYGRFLRHVWRADGSSFNLELVERGFADAVGYGPNSAYWEAFAAAAARAEAAGVGLWGACSSFGAPLVPPTGGAAGGAACDPSYPGVCIPPPPPELDCADVEHRRFAVDGSDPHGFDGDGDGIGCQPG